MLSEYLMGSKTEPVKKQILKGYHLVLQKSENLKDHPIDYSMVMHARCRHSKGLLKKFSTNTQLYLPGICSIYVKNSEVSNVAVTLYIRAPRTAQAP